MYDPLNHNLNRWFIDANIYLYYKRTLYEFFIEIVLIAYQLSSNVITKVKTSVYPKTLRKIQILGSFLLTSTFTSPTITESKG